jgi:hypothetical protein
LDLPLILLHIFFTDIKEEEKKVKRFLVNSARPPSCESPSKFTSIYLFNDWQFGKQLATTAHTAPPAAFLSFLCKDWNRLNKQICSQRRIAPFYHHLTFIHLEAQ